MAGTRRSRWAAALLAALVVLGAPVDGIGPGRASAAVLPAGFSESIAFGGLTNPTNLEFASDGRVFVTEKSGNIKVYDSLTDPTPTTFTGLTTNVHNFWDRGLLGLALDPSLTNPALPLRPWVYVLYSYDHVLGDGAAAPRWGDACPSPPGPTTDGCVISGRLSRFTVSGSTISGPETVLIEDWCQQFPSHSIGDLGFGPDGALYLSAGDGASFNAVDYGQFGGSAGSPIVKNPCGDPPGGAMTPPTAEGGALRSQDVRTDTDPAGLDGSILRIDPVTGAAFAGNPFAASPDLRKRMVIAHGLRNPFRFTLRPGTNELWLGDVGWNTWEEIDRIANIGDATVENFGWPCYEGSTSQGNYDAANVNICENLYAAGSGAITAPVYTYQHGQTVTNGETCGTGSSAIAGMAFYPETGGTFPAQYRGGLFFADHNRNCIWWMAKGTNGQPDPTTRAVFESPAANPVDLEIGADGSLYYVDFDSSSIRKISYTASGGSNPYATVLAGTSPVAYWRLGEASGTTAADSAGTNTGTYAGGPTLAQPGLLTGDANTAVRFDGVNDQVTVPSSASLNQTSRLSITAWFTANAGGWDQPRNARIVQKGVNDSQYRLLVEFGLLKFDIAGVGTVSVAPPSTGVRHFVAGTYDGAALRLYVDGSLLATTPATGAIPTTAEGLAIANKPTSADARDPFVGVIDEVSIHSIALSAAQVGQLWATGSNGPSGGNNAPTAVASANPTSGTAPLTVQFTGSASSDPDPGDTLTYSWDLNGDGTYGDSTVANPSFTYPTAGGFTAALRVTDNHGLPSTPATVPITVNPASGGSNPYATVLAGTSPVAYWRLGEASGTTAADSAGTNTGTYAGGPTLAQPGLLTGDANTAVRFDGVNDQVTVPSSASLNQTSRLSITAWFTANAGGWDQPRNARIVQKGVNDSQYRLLVEFGLLKFDIAGVGTVSVAPPSTGVRHFVAGTYDGAALRLYVDGSLLATTPATGAIPTTAEGLAIANKPTSADARDPFVGVIDEVSIHSIALSAAQVGQLWATGSNGPSGGNNPPVPVISTPTAGTTFAVGQVIPFSGSATDPEDGTLAASRLSWQLTIQHCPASCHAHDIQTFPGVASGSFAAPDHEYPSYLELKLTATDSQGLSSTVIRRIDPKTVTLTFQTSPTGLQLSVGSTIANAPFTQTVIQGSANSVSAVTPQNLGGTTYTYASWSDGGAQSHTIVANASATYTATYTASTTNNAPTAVASANPTSGTAPLTVQFTGSASSDPDPGDTLTYSWDLNGDGTYGDSTVANPSFTYPTAGGFTAALRVTDNHGLPSTPATVPITVNPASGGSNPYATVLAGTSPVAYWRLGEASGTTAADSAGTNTGTYAGGPTLAQPGLLTGDANTAVRFDGVNDQVTVPSSASLNQTSRLSITAWFTANAGGWDQPRNARIVQKGVNDSQYRLLVEFGLLKFDIAGVGTVSVAPPSTGVRHFVAGTYDGAALRLYVDGSLLATTPATGAIPTTAEGLAIANKPTSADARDPFVGVIDEVSIHSIALSAAQVGQLWATGSNGPSGGNNAPTAVASANPTSGTAPLTVQFTGSASSDPDPGDTLTYSWDLNGDGTYGDSTVANPSFTYPTAGGFTAALRVTDNHGLPSTPATVPITVNPASGTTTTLVPTADAEVRNGNQQSNRNYGALPTLAVRSGVSRSHLKFTVPVLTGTIQSAKLRVFVTNASSSAGTCYQSSNSWTETGITWNSAPAITGGSIATGGGATVGTWVEFVVTPIVTSSTTITFVLSDGDNDAVNYSSRTGSNPPQLVIVSGP